MRPPLPFRGRDDRRGRRRTPARPGRLDRAELFAACRAVSGSSSGASPSPSPRGSIRTSSSCQPSSAASSRRSSGRCATKVHHGWGTARAWNEAGIAVLFAGPPARARRWPPRCSPRSSASTCTGSISRRWSTSTSARPRRTSADLRRRGRVRRILFFDEADALFGKRTEVRTPTIATRTSRSATCSSGWSGSRAGDPGHEPRGTSTRRSSGGSAIVEFPVPDSSCAGSGPPGRPPLAGPRPGLPRPAVPAHRREYLLGGSNACLQTAAAETSNGAGPRTSRPALRMDHVLVAVKREHEKFQRTVGSAQLGPYAPIVEALTRD